METESWRRVKCNVCERWYEMFLPFTNEMIVAVLLDKDWTVETHRGSDAVHMHTVSPLVIGRVQCPACRKRK